MGDHPRSQPLLIPSSEFKMKREPISPYFDIKKDAEGRDYMSLFGRYCPVAAGTEQQGHRIHRGYERVARWSWTAYLPPQVNTLEQQVERVYRSFLREPDPIAKYQYLRALQERAETLFLRLHRKTP
ncbi:MAG: hypothetical protein IPL59_17370 [Candidatus Competibacteraceae bacterium]|nr:hypothetical protein [Candidatus Competibacteraceae bacterium]